MLNIKAGRAVYVKGFYMRLVVCTQRHLGQLFCECRRSDMSVYVVVASSATSRCST